MMRTLVFALCCACQTISDPGLPDDCTDGAAVLPLGCGSQPPLTASTAPDWLGAYGCSNSTDLPRLRAELDAVRGDTAVLDAFFAIVDETWTFDGTKASCTDSSATWAAMDAIRA